MKPFEIKKKARAKADATEPRSKVFDFVDKSGVAGSCTVTLPAERFSYIISRRVAENLLIKHKDNLPFDIMRPISVNENDDWKEVTWNDLQDRYEPLAGNQEKCSLKPWEAFEIWMPSPVDDIPNDMFVSPNAK